MPVKKTNKAPAKKTAAKKPVAKKSVVKKTENKKVELEVKETVAKVEKKVEAFEAKTDKEVGNLVKKVGFVDKIINASRIKEILNLSFMESANKRVRKNLELICKILGILGIISGVIMLILSLCSLFTGSFGLFLLYLICCAIVLIVSRGMMKMKKWFPAVAIICLAIDIIVLILSIFTSGLHFGSQLLSLIISIIFTLFILKNKDMFKN